MKFKIERSTLIFLSVAAFVVLLRLFLVFVGYPYIFQEGLALLDDELMYNAANSILEGNWLGEYGPVTLGKNMFFSIYLAIIHLIGIPYLVAGQILFILSSAFFTVAIFPVVKGRYKRLAVFAVCAFNPIAFSDYTNRVYRDNIYPALILFAFAAIIGIALRYKSKTKSLIFYGIIGGISLGCTYLTREDGLWFIPFAVCGTLATVCFIIFDKTCSKKVGKIVFTLLPLFIMGAVLTAYAATNYHYYGRFILNDLTSDEFSKAYGQMLRIDREEFTPVYPLNIEDRDKLYNASPALSELAVILEDMEHWKKITPDGSKNFSSGGFYWALREAAQINGYYIDAKIAEEYWVRVESELAEAYDLGVLEAKYSLSPSLTIPFDTEVIPLLVKETLSSTKSILFFENLSYEPKINFPQGEYILEQLEFLNTSPIGDNIAEQFTTKIVGWALISDSHIEDIKITDSSGAPVDFEITFLPSNDVAEHFSALLNLDYKYSENARFEIEAEIPYGDPITIEFHSKDEKYIIDISDEVSVQSANNFFANIESVENLHSYRLTGSYRSIAYFILDIILLVYKIFTLPFIILSLISIFYKFDIKKKGLIYLILLGIGLSIVLRILMIAYVEVTAFGIGTYIMYLASVYPLIYAFITLSIASFTGFSFNRNKVKQTAK